MALLVTMWFDALCEIRFANADRVAALADEMHSLVQGKTACRWFRGWARVGRGKPLEGFQQIRAAYEENTALGMITGGSETLGYAAEALVLHGDWSGAEEQLRQALEIVNTYGERIYLPQLLLTEAAIARGRGQHADADASIRRAITEARAQGARWLETLASGRGQFSLVGCPSEPLADRQGPVSGQFDCGVARGLAAESAHWPKMT
jgi:ATP/maltotriose-dependent transcriptional regulator MalT